MADIGRLENKKKSFPQPFFGFWMGFEGCFFGCSDHGFGEHVNAHCLIPRVSRIGPNFPCPELGNSSQKAQERSRLRSLQGFLQLFWYPLYRNSESCQDRMNLFSQFLGYHGIVFPTITACSLGVSV